MESLRPALATLRLSAPRRAAHRPLYQCLHTTATWQATPLPHPTVPGPPPATPTPHPSDAAERVARKRRQAELVKQAQDVRTSSVPSSKPKAMLKKRFWKDVIVKETDGRHRQQHRLGRH
jgi:ATP synthase F1 complex assembly factor 2|tara:strand:+ start:1754 stop:2113 length:360 start_codon:yes stop_codon:yes gene_type:complete